MILIITCSRTLSYTAWNTNIHALFMSMIHQICQSHYSQKYAKYETCGMKSQDLTTVGLQQDEVSLDFKNFAFNFLTTRKVTVQTEHRNAGRRE